MGLLTWKWLAAGVLLGILTLLMVTGLGSRRGTWLNGIRLSLWALVLALGGIGAGCSGRTQIGQPDAGSEPGPDLADPGPDLADPEPDFSCVECYAAPWDPPPDAPEDPIPDPDDDDAPEDAEQDEETDD